MKTITRMVPVLVAAAACCATTLAAQHQDELGKAVTSARVPLERGLAASASHGQPISGKFEMEDGHLQLSVYTAKDGKFSEVIVDQKTGKVATAEPITEGEDLSAATDQNAAMAMAKVSLRAAVQQALRTNPGFRAVSVVPSLKDGRAVADVRLAKDAEFKSIAVPLR